MIEVEVKLPVAELHSIKQKLLDAGFGRKQLLKEEDHYFDSAKGVIRRNGEALRIRRTEDLLSHEVLSMVTFKGKKVDQVSMTRRELETGIADAAVMTEVFAAIGYQEVLPAVVKTRDELSCGRMNACLDEVDGLGSFLELEIVLEEDGDRELALAQIEELLQRLGYGLSDTIRTSYLTLLQNASAKEKSGNARE